MLSKTMQDAYSEQIRNEFSSAYLYLSMALYFEGQSLPAGTDLAGKAESLRRAGLQFGLHPADVDEKVARCSSSPGKLSSGCGSAGPWRSSGSAACAAHAGLVATVSSRVGVRL
jgi:hypothetical protein